MSIIRGFSGEIWVSVKILVLKIEINRNGHEFKNSVSNYAVILLINGLGALFATSAFLEAANFTLSPSLLTVGQFVGMTFLFLAILSWRIPDVAGEALASFGKLFALGQGMWVVIIGYHVISGQASGPTAYVNLIITIILGILFLTASRKSD